MPKRGAKAGVGNKDSSGHGVYGFIGDMIRKGKNAKFVNKKGRYVLNWSIALKHYAIYKSKKNPQFKSKNINRRKASNSLRAALLNIYKKDGAKEYKGSRKRDNKDKIIKRQFQMPSKVFQSLFGSKVELSDDSDQKTSSTSSEEQEEGDKDSGVLSTQGPIEERMDVEMASGNKDSSGHDVTSSTSSENDLDMLMNVALAKKPLSLEDSSGKSEDILEVFPNRGPIEEREEGDNDSDILGMFPNSGPMEERVEGDNDSDILEIFPNNGPIEVGSPFVLVFGQSLEVESARVEFGGKAATDLPRVNDFNLIGRIPASDTPGNVTVTVRSSTGRILGKTDFCYNDRENTSQAIHVAVAGAATRGDTYAKNVMLLKNEDLAQRDGKILMPTTIEMARMRNTGQYKKHVQFSKSMSEDAVRKTIQETFPAFDLSGRFYCASISNTDSTLQFHGDPRVWDGKTIRRILKGNSTFYIVMEDIQDGLDILMKVALALKEREEGDNDSDILGMFPNSGPMEERVEGDNDSDILVIFPNNGPIEGGSPFVLFFGQSLEVGSARVEFGGKAATVLQRVHDFELIGRIPASDTPGNVTVTLRSSTGRILGKTDFCYNDRDILGIFPNEGPIEGGLSFLLVFRQSRELESARVEFGGKAATDLQRVHDCNLIGRIPASDTPGNVTVTVRSSTGRILGKTDFCYNDRDILGTSSELGPSEVTNFLL